MESQLSLEFLRAVENAAIAAVRTMGFGDCHKAEFGDPFLVNAVIHPFEAAPSVQ